MMFTQNYTLRFAAIAMVAMLFIQAQPPIESSEPIGIQFFEGSWEEALKQAKAEDKLIFLDAYAAWCGPCKMLKRNVFTQQEVGDYFNAEFINVAMDMEKGEGPALSRKFGVTAYPTLIFVDGDGKVITKAIGYHNAQQLIGLGKRVQGQNS